MPAPAGSDSGNTQLFVIAPVSDLASNYCKYIKLRNIPDVGKNRLKIKRDAMPVARNKLIFEWNLVIGKPINLFVSEDSNFKIVCESHAE